LMVGKDKRRATLYAYAQADETALRQTASETGTPDALSLVALSDLRTKPMPEVWKEGRRFAFDVRVRPVRRLLKPLEGAEGGSAKPFRKGAEVDAFLVAALRNAAGDESGASKEPITREEVYRAWLDERFADAARLDGANLVRMERTRIARTRTAEGPDAVFHGELTVTNGEAFAKLLAKGVGRHTAYGYGMLLLRPARS
ncbi:MAG: type I-E CRISPR-associated protein Cas6/Cse3/CasE, partial [Oceanibaculum sp.]